MNSTEEIGYCSAYCKTWHKFKKTCKGYKQEYLDSFQELSRAKYKMKQCSLTRGHITCGDCGVYESCQSVHPFLNHPSYKYSKHK